MEVFLLKVPLAGCVVYMRVAALLADFWVGRYILDVVVNPPQRDRLVPPIFYAEFQKLSDWRMVVVELRIKLVMHATTYIHI